ncbi:MAG TPA: SdpI family protein [Candidatus Humimicrobiaceae bacterium]|nr:SdpI family protein [Candidatus Humimicrobiaceae bacterium]
MEKSKVIIIGIIILSFLVGVYFYSQMPERMASHWNAQGEVDGYMSKGRGLFFMPLMSAGLLLLFLIIPKIDPLKENIKKFRKYFDGFIVLLMLFLFYVYLLTIFWNIGARFNMSQLMIPAMGILFYYCGILVENAKRNWFIGIRTPWTLSSEAVWDKTHKIGGRLFKIAGVVAFLGIFFPKQSILFVLIPVLLVTAYTLIYSYFEYQKEIKKSNKL